jgi:hypothetical protein
LRRGSLELMRPVLLQKLRAARVWNSVWLKAYEKKELAAW